MVESVCTAFGRIDVCVTCAYYSHRASFLDLEWPLVAKTFEVTQNGTFHVCQLVARKMAKQLDKGGKIIIISSVMADHPHLIPTSTPYNMAKAAIDCMMRFVCLFVCLFVYLSLLLCVCVIKQRKRERERERKRE